MRRLAYLGAHEKHAALGGAGCESCHAGIYSGDAAQNVSADPALCAGCHNGQAFPEVGYTDTHHRKAA